MFVCVRVRTLYKYYDDYRRTNIHLDDNPHAGRTRTYVQ